MKSITKLTQDGNSIIITEMKNDINLFQFWNNDEEEKSLRLVVNLPAATNVLMLIKCAIEEYINEVDKWEADE